VAIISGGETLTNRAKNRVINGNMRIDQRNVTSTINATGVTYNVDRWLGRGVGSDGVFTLAQDTTSPVNFTNSLKAAVTTADGDIAAGSSYRIQQHIEGNNIADLNWGTSDAQSVTLSFFVRSSVTGTFGGSLANGDFDRFNVFSYTISSADTWEKKTITIAGDTTGTWYTNTSIGIRINFSLGAGSNLLASAGSWGASTKEGVSSQVNLIATNSATFYLTGVQLEPGITATSFEHRQFGQELELCQRYYYKRVQGLFGLGFINNTTTMGVSVTYPVSMRIAPTALEQTGTAANYQIVHLATAAACSAVPAFGGETSTDATRVTATVGSGLTAGQAGGLRSGASGAYLAWSAEL